VSALTQLLERLRRVRLAPGGEAGVVAVPSAGDELSGEVAFLFEHLDEIEERSELLLSSAHSEAAGIEAAARVQCDRLLNEASGEANRIAAELLAERRADGEGRARVVLADAEREVERVRARGRERTPAWVAEVVARMLEGVP
jgi:vacuolar-type H+-ATPase subunit H